MSDEKSFQYAKRMFPLFRAIVIGLSEIRLKNEVPKKNFEIPGYKFYNISSLCAAGGVGFYVTSDQISNKRDELSSRNTGFETILVEIVNLWPKNVLCCCVYRHPITDILRFNERLREILSAKENENKVICIMGDFNINLMDYENRAQTNDFISMMFSHHLQPSVLHPTRITDSISTVID